MYFYLKKFYLLDNLKLLIKDNNLYFKYIFNSQVIYFKLSNKLFFYFHNNYLYILGFLFHKAKIHSLFKNLFNVFSKNLQKFKILLYVRGYDCRVEILNQFLIFFLGYTHPIIYKLPKYLNAGVFENKSMDNEFYIESFNKNILLAVLIDLKKLRTSVDLYGGKGVFLIKEVFVARKTKKEIKK